MSAAPAMPLFIDAYLADTTHLSAEEHGVYLLLLMSMWRRNGKVPDDDKDLARIVGVTLGKWRSIKARLMPFLTIEGGEIGQKRLQKEWEYVQEKRAKNAQNGAKGGRAGINKNKDIDQANGSVSLNPDASTHTHTHTQEEKKETPTASSPPTDLYAFQASTIRLTKRDFDHWERAFPHITLESELWALDEWAGEQPKWFPAVSGALAKKERAARERINLRKVEMEAGPARRAAPDGRI